MRNSSQVHLGRKTGREAGWCVAALCGLVAFACYANGLRNGFCDDDYPIIVNNDLVTEPGQWGRLWLTDYWHRAADETPYRDLLYRPVAILSYRLNHACHGLRPFGYHLVNVVLHAAVSMLVCRLAARMTASRGCAAVAGIAFAVLPIHTEAVNNVVGRAELLVALFLLLALWAFEPSDRPRGWPAGALRWVAGTVAVFAALGAKETGVAVVALVPLFRFARASAAFPPPAAAPLRRSGPIGARTSWPGLAGPAVAVAAAAGVYLALRLAALGDRLYQPVTLTKSINVLVDATVWQRVCGALQLWGLYWAKTFWPRVLVITYSINAVTLADTLTHRHVLIGLGVTGLLLAVAVGAGRRGDRTPAVWLAALLASYLPVSNTGVLIKTFFAERVWYVPSIWVVLLMSWCVCVGLPGLLASTPRRRRLTLRIGVGLMVLASAAAFARCWARNRQWQDNGTLYAAAYRDHPEAINALMGYGRWLIEYGHYEQGVQLLERVVLIDIGFTHAHRDLGWAMLEHGDVEGALKHLSIAESQIPGHPPTRARLRQAQAALADRLASSIAELEERLTAHPNEVDAWLALADRLTDAGRVQDAANRMLQAETRFAHDVRYLRRAAAALVLAGRPDDAIARYRSAIHLAPDDAAMLTELAMLLLDRNRDGDGAEARALTQQATQIDPGHVQVRMGRAEVLALDGRRAEAAAIYRALATSLPDGELRQRCRLRAEFLEK